MFLSYVIIICVLLSRKSEMCLEVFGNIWKYLEVFGHLCLNCTYTASSTTPVEEKGRLTEWILLI